MVEPALELPQSGISQARLQAVAQFVPSRRVVSPVLEQPGLITDVRQKSAAGLHMSAPK